MSNMVSKILNKGLLLIAALLVFSACEKPFKLDLPLAVDSHEYKLSAKAGQARIFFYTTMPWSITTDPGECPWAVINRTSGTGEEDVEEIVVTYEQNEEPDRQVTLIITAGDLQETIILFQTGTAREWWDGSTTVEDLVIKPQY